MLSRERIVAVVVGGLLACTLAGCGGGSDGGRAEPASAAPGDTAAASDAALARALPPGATPEMAREGRRLFPTCAVCHGFDAAGTQLGPSLRDGEWIAGTGEFDQIVDVIRAGVPEPQEFPTPMPPQGGGDFTDEQIRALAAYVYALSHGAS